jgi:hypothetical protein
MFAKKIMVSRPGDSFVRLAFGCKGFRRSLV